jgi:hypothetical protein
VSLSVCFNVCGWKMRVTRFVCVCVCVCVCLLVCVGEECVRESARARVFVCVSVVCT